MSWFVIRHTPADAAGESVFSDPRFAEHVAFLRGLQERGWLVAAGPLPDRPGSGMAVLRVILRASTSSRGGPAGDRADSYQRKKAPKIGAFLHCGDGGI